MLNLMKVENCLLQKCLTPEQLDTISDNFIFITYKENEKDLIEIKRTIITEKGENIPITEIATDNFLKVYKTINQLIPGMTPKNIRDTQRLVKRIVPIKILPLLSVIKRILLINMDIVLLKMKRFWKILYLTIKNLILKICVKKDLNLFL